MSEMNGFDCLLSLNVKDFGARKRIIKSVLDAGRHAVVLRGGKQVRKGTPWQVRVLAATTTDT